MILESWSGEWLTYLKGGGGGGALLLPIFNVVFSCVLETDNISKI